MAFKEMKLMFPKIDDRLYDMEKMYEELGMLLMRINEQTGHNFSVTFPGELMNIKDRTYEVVIHNEDYVAKVSYMEYEIAKVYFREGATIGEVKRKVRKEISKAFLRNDVNR